MTNNVTRRDFYAAPILASLLRRAVDGQDWANLVPVAFVIAEKAMEVSDHADVADNDADWLEAHRLASSDAGMTCPTTDEISRGLWDIVKGADPESARKAMSLIRGIAGHDRT